MGRGDNRRSPKMRRRVSQKKYKLRLKAKREGGKKDAPSAKAGAQQSAGS